MKTRLAVAFFLIYVFAGANQGLSNYSSNAPPEYNIVSSEMFVIQPKRKKDKRSAGEIIRGILNRRQERMIPPVIEEKIHPPMDFYLDPPRFSLKDKSRLA